MKTAKKSIHEKCKMKILLLILNEFPLLDVKIILKHLISILEFVHHRI